MNLASDSSDSDSSDSDGDKKGEEEGENDGGAELEEAQGDPDGSTTAKVMHMSNLSKRSSTKKINEDHPAVRARRLKAAKRKEVKSVSGTLSRLADSISGHGGGGGGGGNDLAAMLLYLERSTQQAQQREDRRMREEARRQEQAQAAQQRWMVSTHSARATVVLTHACVRP